MNTHYELLDALFELGKSIERAKMSNDEKDIRDIVLKANSVVNNITREYPNIKRTKGNLFALYYEPDPVTAIPETIEVPAKLESIKGINIPLKYICDPHLMETLFSILIEVADYPEKISEHDILIAINRDKAKEHFEKSIVNTKYPNTTFDSALFMLLMINGKIRDKKIAFNFCVGDKNIMILNNIVLTDADIELVCQEYPLT